MNWQPARFFFNARAGCSIGGRVVRLCDDFSFTDYTKLASPAISSGSPDAVRHLHAAVDARVARLRASEYMEELPQADGMWTPWPYCSIGSDVIIVACAEVQLLSHASCLHVSM
jgi:hypothetical protein